MGGIGMKKRILSTLEAVDDATFLGSRREAMRILILGTIMGMSGLDIGCVSKEERMQRAGAAGQDMLSRGLLTIHKVITRGLSVSLENVRRYEAEGRIPTDESRGFLMYVTSLHMVLHGHHLSEDEISFPYFQKKLPNVPYDALTDQHRRMVSLLDRIAAQETALAVGAGAVELGTMKVLLENVNAIWVPHIDIEESSFSAQRLRPLVDAGEQARLTEKISKHSMHNSGAGPTTLPFLLYNLDGGDRAFLQAELPWIVKDVFVPLLWRNQWAPMRRFLLS